MPCVSLQQHRRLTGLYINRQDKNGGRQKKHDHHIKKIARQPGLHSKNVQQQQMANLLLLLLSSIRNDNIQPAISLQKAESLRLNENIQRADAHTRSHIIAQVVAREVRRSASAPARSASPVRPYTTSAPLTCQGVRAIKKRSLPITSRPEVATTAATFVKDVIKISPLPRFVVKKYHGWGDIFASIGRGGAKPFTSLMDMGNHAYALLSGKEVNLQTKKVLRRIGGVIDDITSLIPKVNLSRIPFKFSLIMSTPEKTPNIDDLIDLLNDLNALKAFMKQDSFSVRHTEHRLGEKGATVLVIDSKGKSHTLPVRWFKKRNHPDGGEWQVPLSGYRASKKEMLIEQGKGIYHSPDERNFIEINHDYYPVEFIKGQPDNAFIINGKKRTTIPVERVPGNDEKWRVIYGMRNKKNISAAPDIVWEHRLASAASAHALDIAEPDVTTGIVTIDGEEYIKGNYGVYKVEYNNELRSYVVKTEDGLDYPVEFKRDSFSWETKIFSTPQHRYTTSGLGKISNVLKKQMIEKELRRRNESPMMNYRTTPGGEVKIGDINHRFEADGFAQLEQADFRRFTKLQRTLKDAENYLKSAQTVLANAANPEARKVLSEHFAIPESDITDKLINEVKNNLIALQSGMLWLRRCNYSIMTLKNFPDHAANYDAAYYPVINKIAFFDGFFNSGRWYRLHTLLHELGHGKLIDLKFPGLSIPDLYYVGDELNDLHYGEIAKGDWTKAAYDDDEGGNFMRKMKAKNLKEAWRSYATNPKKRIKINLSNPDSIAGLTVALGRLLMQRLPAADRKRRAATVETRHYQRGRRSPAG